MNRFPAPEAVAPPDPLLPAPFRVVRRRRETHDTWTIELEPAGEPLGDPVRQFAPGQFAMLYAFGTGEVPISLAGGGDGDGQVHTVRAVGAVTEAICRTDEGEVLGIRGPYGTRWPLTAAEGHDVIIAAGGLGLPPLRPAIRHILEHRDRYGEVAVLYGARSPAELLYRDELREWTGRRDVQVEVTVDTAGPDWTGRVGLITALVPRINLDPANAVAMMVGPEIMMRFMSVALRDRGLPNEAIWLSLERSMKCAVGWCGHCQLGPFFVCRDGPVVRRDQVEPFLAVNAL